jgi:hypothetical protein
LKAIAADLGIAYVTAKRRRRALLGKVRTEMSSFFWLESPMAPMARRYLFKPVARNESSGVNILSAKAAPTGQSQKRHGRVEEWEEWKMKNEKWNMKLKTGN